MEMSGKQDVPLSREKVWQALNDRDVLAACIPGCEVLEQTSDSEFKATVRAAVGPVKSRFKGRMTLSDPVPPERYTLSFQGEGGASFVKGSATVELQAQESGDGTRITYDAKATVGGKLAQVGSRLIDGAARKMANDFFANLTQRLGGSYREPESESEAKSGNADTTQPARAPAARDKRMPWLALSGVIAIILIALWIWSTTA